MSQLVPIGLRRAVLSEDNWILFSDVITLCDEKVQFIGNLLMEHAIMILLG